MCGPRYGTSTDGDTAADAEDTGDTGDTDDTDSGGTDLPGSDPVPPADSGTDTDPPDDTAADTGGDPLCVPAPAELCNGVDDDGDGETDEDAVDPRAWHPDADSDGYGAPGVAVVACDAPAGHVDNGRDCDDADSAATTTCGALFLRGTDAAVLVASGGDVDGDGADELFVRSDGYAFLDGAASGNVAMSATILATAPYYDGEAIAGDFNGDSIADLAWCTTEYPTDPSPYKDRYYPLELHGWLRLGPLDTSTAPTLELVAADGLIAAEGLEYPGCRMGGGGDVDGDGVPDLLFGVGYDIGLPSPLYWLPAHSTGVVDVATLDSVSMYEGYAAIEVVDVDGDGVDDVISALYTNGVQIVLGPLTDWRDAWMVMGSGSSLHKYSAAGDLDRDGLPDLILTDTVTGELLVVTEKGRNVVAQDCAWMRIDADHGGAAVGDVDGDGRNELLVGLADGDPGERGSYGGLFVFDTPQSGSFTLLDAAQRLTGATDGDGFGRNPTVLGDVDSDGADDVAVSSGLGVHRFPSL